MSGFAGGVRGNYVGEVRRLLRNVTVATHASPLKKFDVLQSKQGIGHPLPVFVDRDTSLVWKNQTVAKRETQQRVYKSLWEVYSSDSVSVYSHERLTARTNSLHRLYMFRTAIYSSVASPKSLDCENWYDGLTKQTILTIGRGILPTVWYWWCFVILFCEL